jgi:hypothetical protein
MYFLIALMLELQAPTGTPTAEPIPATSLERIRQALEEPQTTVTIVSNDPSLPPVFRMDIERRPLPFEHLWQGDYASAHVRPLRGLTHHEFLEQVTPDFFRATSMYPCCPVLPALRLLRAKLGPTRRESEAKARAEVKKALKEFQDAVASERKY